MSYPSYWFRPARILPANQGHNRWIWDLRYAPPEGFPRAYPISAIYHDTPSGPEGPLALPGEYTVRLTVNGQAQTQKLTLRNDPRVPSQPTNHALRAYEGLQKAQAKKADALARQFLALMELLDNSDFPPTTQAIAALAGLEAQLK